MGRDVHRKLLRHVPEDAFASHASAAGAFDAPGTYAAQYHLFSPDPSSPDGARETSSFRDNPRVSSSSSHAASASGAASTVTVFMFILLPVVFLVHCCCCGTRADAFDPGGVDGHWGRRRRRVGARERRGGSRADRREAGQLRATTLTTTALTSKTPRAGLGPPRTTIPPSMRARPNRRSTTMRRLARRPTPRSRRFRGVSRATTIGRFLLRDATSRRAWCVATTSSEDKTCA